MTLSWRKTQNGRWAGVLPERSGFSASVVRERSRFTVRLTLYGDEMLCERTTSARKAKRAAEQFVASFESRQRMHLAVRRNLLDGSDIALRN